MAIIKATLAFGQRQQGWSESYFFQSANLNLKTHADTWTSPVINKRRPLLGNRGRVKALRMSVEYDAEFKKVGPDSYLKYIDQEPSASNPESEDASTALQVIFRDATFGQHKFLFMRGIYDSIVAQGGAYDPTKDGWSGRFNDWVSFLLEQQVGWVHSKREKDVEIIGYTQVPDSEVVEITLKEPTFGAGPYKEQYVRIRGLNYRKSALNGAVLVKPRTTTICRTVDAIAVGPFKDEGMMRTYSVEFTRADTIEGQKIVTRKAGAPLLESRGRSPVRVRS